MNVWLLSAHAPHVPLLATSLMQPSKMSGSPRPLRDAKTQREVGIAILIMFSYERNCNKLVLWLIMGGHDVDMLVLVRN